MIRSRISISSATARVFSKLIMLVYRSAMGRTCFAQPCAQPSTSSLRVLRYSLGPTACIGIIQIVEGSGREF